MKTYVEGAVASGRNACGEHDATGNGVRRAALPFRQSAPDLDSFPISNLTVTVKLE